MKRIVVLLLLTLASISSANGVTYTGEFTSIDSPGIDEEGYSVIFNGKWKLDTLLGEPTVSISYDWRFASSGNKVRMQIKPYGEEIVRTITVPVDIARQSKPFNIHFKASVKDLPGGSIEIDGGSVINGKSFTVTGSPNWQALFKQNGKFIPEAAAKAVMAAGVGLNFNFYSPTMDFALADIKLWYAKNQRHQYKQTACKRVTDLYNGLAEISPNYSARLNKIRAACKDVSKISKATLDKEIANMQKTAFASEHLPQELNESMNANLQQGLAELKDQLNRLFIPKISEAKIAELYAAEQNKDTYLVLGEKPPVEKQIKKKLKPSIKDLQRLLNNHVFDDGYDVNKGEYSFRRLSNCTAEVTIKYYTSGVLDIDSHGIVDLSGPVRFEGGSVQFSGKIRTEYPRHGTEQNEAIAMFLLHSLDKSKKKKEKQILSVARSVVNGCR